MSIMSSQLARFRTLPCSETLKQPLQQEVCARARAASSSAHPRFHGIRQDTVKHPMSTRASLTEMLRSKHIIIICHTFHPVLCDARCHLSLRVPGECTGRCIAHGWRFERSLRPKQKSFTSWPRAKSSEQLNGGEKLAEEVGGF